MSSKSAASSGKSPYQRSNSGRRGRSWMLMATVIILLVATVAWITSYTSAVVNTPPGAAASPIAPVGSGNAPAR